MFHSPDVTWQEGELARAERWRALGHRGATVWLTGLPASGKSTLAAALEARLVHDGRPAYVLDGDNLRHGLCADLGFSARDRACNVARAGEVARMFADAGVIAIVALVSPLADAREAVRERHAADGLRFLEVFVDTPLEVCEARDPKGLYRRARSGELSGFTGVDAPFEEPPAPDLRVGDDAEVEAEVTAVLERLDASPDGWPGEQKENPRCS